MTILECLSSALKSIRSNKLRSALTLLGIVIGVASVIALLSLGEGAKQNIMGEIQGIGSNLIIIQPNWNNEQVREGRRVFYDDDDVRSILRSCPSVRRVAPQSFMNGQVSYGNKYAVSRLTGTTSDYVEMRGMDLSGGRFFSELDVSGRRRVAVLASGLAEELYGRSDPVGKFVKINGIRFRIIGVIAAKETNQFAMDQTTDDRMIFLPVTTLSRFTREQRYRVLFAQSTTTENTKQAADEIRWYLDHSQGRDFSSVQSQEDLLKMVSTVLVVFTAVLGGIGSISLIVGGIGIMNIMLVSVTERTREIGIRKAVGAKRRDILVQFLVESVMLCLFGGLIGIAFGRGIAGIISSISPVKAVVSASAIILASASAVFVGLASGVYPAWKAARLDPIESLRFE